MKNNSWLENSDFIAKLKFKDKYYLETLCFKIAAYIKNAPIPILSSFDVNHNSIYLSVGDNKKYFNITTDIAYYDFISLMKEWCSQFYPQYKVEVEKEIEYTDEEIIELVKEKGLTLNDALQERKIIKYIESGIIEKVYFGNNNNNRDCFILNINGNRQMRTSGNINIGVIMPISEFMEKLRRIGIENPIMLREFILTNSKIVYNIKSDGEILISYSGAQMLNFIRINFNSLINQGYELEQEDGFTYKWGMFRIIFDSRILMQDCLNEYQKLLSKRIHQRCKIDI